MAQQYSTEHLETHERVEPSAPITPTPPTIQPVRRDRNRLLAFVLIGIGIAMLARNVNSGGEQRSSIDVPMQGAQVVQLQVETGNGNVELGTEQDSDRLVGGNVVYHGDLDIDDNSRDDDERSVRLRVRRTGFLWFGNGSSANWDLRLNPQAHYELEIDNGNGQVDLDLGSLTVEQLNISAGNGEVDLDLPQQGALEGEIDVGNGTLNLTLPKDRALRVTLDHGNGELNMGPLVKNDGRSGRDGVYETPNFDTVSSAERMELEIDSGNGTINVR